MRRLFFLTLCILMILSTIRSASRGELGWCIYFTVLAVINGLVAVRPSKPPKPRLHIGNSPFSSYEDFCTSKDRARKWDEESRIDPVADDLA